MHRTTKLILLFSTFLSFTFTHAKILIPMDLTQTDHLMAYGIAYNCLLAGENVEWLLNYRGGSFLMADNPAIRKLCNLRGVRYEVISPSQEITIRQTIEKENMDAMLLEKAPKIAVYVPPNHEPWDDAVRLALEYAKIPYDRIWDKEVLQGKLKEYDWLHLHHEDFTGQYGKFLAGHGHADWYQEDVILNTAMAKSLGFKKVSKLKLAVVKEIKKYIEDGGMVFAMCSSTDTPDIALAAENTDIVPKEFDGDPVDPNYMSKLNYANCLAFENFTVVIDPYVYEHSDIDTYIESSARGPNVYFSLFDFSAKYDPVPTMLVQNHVALVKEFLGQNCGFRRDKIKKNVLILGEVPNTEEVKYIHGKFGKGTFTFLGGHDPEDFAHRIGDPQTNLELHKNSPGYRLILNNVLFPAAQKKPLKT
ncbi:MAG: asparagine synthetase B [candidate division WOR-3 bacterium]|nr:asparagine synthetase B [candidate division WOR-3 bacterium]